jgi:hypothetical protein
MIHLYESLRGEDTNLAVSVLGPPAHNCRLWRSHKEEESGWKWTERKKREE